MRRWTLNVNLLDCMWQIVWHAKLDAETACRHVVVENPRLGASRRQTGTGGRGSYALQRRGSAGTGPKPRALRVELLAKTRKDESKDRWIGRTATLRPRKCGIRAGMQGSALSPSGPGVCGATKTSRPFLPESSVVWDVERATNAQQHPTLLLLPQRQEPQWAHGSRLQRVAQKDPSRRSGSSARPTPSHPRALQIPPT